MRAYMSGDRSTREVRLPLAASWFPDGHVGGMADRAEVALAEARAILAETEPPRRFTGEPDPYSYMVADWPGFKGSMYACALAESLAAFVGEGN